MRPAPGASPTLHQQIQPLNSYAAAAPQLSNDQFLQWGQNPQSNDAQSYPDPSLYNSAAYAVNQDVAQNAPQSNQLTRRPMNQLVSRGKGYNDASGLQRADPNTSANDQGGSGGWDENEGNLEQKAMAAKKDAQAKRKQIPPFVQKLSR